MLQACWKISTFWFRGKKDIITRWEYCYRDNDIVLSSKEIFIYADNLYLFIHLFISDLFICLFVQEKVATVKCNLRTSHCFRTENF